MIAFKQDTTLQIIEEFDEKHDEIKAQSVETFKAGEKLDAEIVGDDDLSPFCQIQFGNGDVAYAVERESFDVLP